MSPKRRSAKTRASSGCGLACQALLTIARRFAQLAGLGEHAAGERGGRHQRRRQLRRFERKRLGVVAVGLFGRERAGGEHHRALAAIDRLVERALGAFEERQRAGPIAGGAAEFEHGFAGPGERRTGPHRLFGEGAGAGEIAAPLRLDEQAVQAERLGIGAARHGAESAFGGFAVAGELRRLRVSSSASGSAGAMRLASALCLRAASEIAGADGDEPARDRLVGALAAAAVQQIEQRERRIQHGAQQVHSSARTAIAASTARPAP